MRKLKIICFFTVLFMIALISKSNASQISATEIQDIMNPGDTGSITISFDSDKAIGGINLRVQLENMKLISSQQLNGWSDPLNDLENGCFSLLKASGGESGEVLKLNFEILDTTGTASLTVLDDVEIVDLDYNKEFVSGFTKSCSVVPGSPFDSLVGLRIATNPDKTTYKEGEFFDPTGMVVMAQYSNGDEIHTMDFVTSPIRALTTSDKVVTVSYTEDNVTKEAYVSITVTKEDDTTQQGEQIPHTEAGPTLSELRLDKKPNKVAYVEGDTFDATGMVLTAVYSDGTSTQITDYTISSKKALTVDDKAIVVSYTAGEVTKEVSIDITVAKKQEEDKGNKAEDNKNAGKEEKKEDKSQVPASQTPQAGTGKMLVGSMGVCGLIVAASYVLSKKQF